MSREAASFVGICVARVDDVVVQVERQAHQPVLPSRREHLVDRHRHLPLARRRIHASDALACALRHPQHIVRSPRHFVRPGESRHDLALAELLRPADHGLRPILRNQAHKCDQAAHGCGNKFSHGVSNGSRYYRILRFAALHGGWRTAAKKAVKARVAEARDYCTWRQDASGL